MESPEEVAAALYSSSSSGGGGNGTFAKRKRTKRGLPPLAEEEDTAHCLILLAQGRRALHVDYECKTCSKRFPSFQALGGHRTSHKKTRTAADGNIIVVDGVDGPETIGTSSASAGSLRLHECSICGSEFASGQALGGHMRRHRPAAAAAAPSSRKEEETVLLLLSLDLNLPAPPEENNSMAVDVTFAGQRRPMALVGGCHY